MTFYDKIFQQASTVNGMLSSPVLFDSMKEHVRPYIIEQLDKTAQKMQYDGWTYDRPATEYPPVIYILLWEDVRSGVLKFLEENHPEAWFKPLFYTVEQQREMGMPI